MIYAFVNDYVSQHGQAPLGVLSVKVKTFSELWRQRRTPTSFASSNSNNKKNTRRDILNTLAWIQSRGVEVERFIIYLCIFKSFYVEDPLERVRKELDMLSAKPILRNRVRLSRERVAEIVYTTFKYSNSERDIERVVGVADYYEYMSDKQEYDRLLEENDIKNIVVRVCNEQGVKNV
jgi:hypothetical protein